MLPTADRRRPSAERTGVRLCGVAGERGDTLLLVDLALTAMIGSTVVGLILFVLIWVLLGRAQRKDEPPPR